MPLLIERRDVVAYDWLVAAAAMRGEEVVEVGATVRLAVVLVEALVAEEVVTSGAEEMLRVPSVVQCSDALLGKKSHRLNSQPG